MEFAHLLTLGAYWLRETNRRGLGVLLGILSGSVPPGSPNHDPIKFRAKIVLFHTGLKTRPLKSQPVFIPGLQSTNKKILHMHCEFAYFYFLLHLELKRKLRSCTPVVPSKTIPDSRQKQAKCIAVFRPKRPKNHTLWGVTYLITWNFHFTLISRYKNKKIAKLK